MKESTLAQILRVMGVITFGGGLIYAIYTAASIPVELLSHNIVLLLILAVFSTAIVCGILFGIARILNNTASKPTPQIPAAVPPLQNRITSELFYLSSASISNGDFGEMEAFLNLIGLEHIIQIVACPVPEEQNNADKRPYLVIYSMPETEIN